MVAPLDFSSRFLTHDNWGEGWGTTMIIRVRNNNEHQHALERVFSCFERDTVVGDRWVGLIILWTSGILHVGATTFYQCAVWKRKRWAKMSRWRSAGGVAQTGRACQNAQHVQPWSRCAAAAEEDHTWGGTETLSAKRKRSTVTHPK